MNTSRKRSPVALSAHILEELRDALPSVADKTVTALAAEVAEYGPGAVSPEPTRTIRAAVELALANFLEIAANPLDTGGAAPIGPALEAAYALGRGEARAGRTMEALLAAYRVGARVAWQEQSAMMLDRRVSAATIARLAQLSFAYIDELSGASVAGHRDELATTGRVREQLLERLAQALLEGEPADRLVARAARADWPVPDTITAVLLPAAHLAQAAALVNPRALRLAGDLAPGPTSDDPAVLLVPDVGAGRAALVRSLSGRGAVVGPTRAWTDADRSYDRALRARSLPNRPTQEALDTEERLLELTLTADEDALGDLRSRTLAPLERLRPAAADRLTATLRSWLLHLGRRGDVAEDLHLHPQTVRYRMNQIEALFGARLTDPEAVLELIVALAAAPSANGMRLGPADDGASA